VQKADGRNLVAAHFHDMLWTGNSGELFASASVMQQRPTVSLLTASLFWAASSIASSAGAEQLAPQRSSREPVPERASLHFSFGVGGGNVGAAARTALDVEYWLLDNVGIGVLGALGAQTALLGSSFSYAFVGPALMLRDRATKSGFFATGAFGLTNGGYTYNPSGGGPLSCDFDCDSIPYDIRAPGVVLNAGLTGRAGKVDLGGMVAVDLISAQLAEPRLLNTVTFNFIVGFPLL
jgi:hypothetical protein